VGPCASFGSEFARLLDVGPYLTVLEELYYVFANVETIIDVLPFAPHSVHIISEGKRLQGSVQQNVVELHLT